MLTRVWSYNQTASMNRFGEVATFDVKAGVCAAMTYYVIKRHLANLITTPFLLDRKMASFVSMQRANSYIANWSANSRLPQLGHGDNLQSGYSQLVGGLDIARRTALMGINSPGGRVGIYIAARWHFDGSGHATAFLVDNGTAEIFDANTGLYESTNPVGDLQGIFANVGWPPADRYACIAFAGVPRDLGSLVSD